VVEVADADPQPKLVLNFLRQLPGRQRLVLSFALKQVGPHRRVDVLVMAETTIQQCHPAPPASFILGLELADLFWLEFKLKFDTPLVEQLASL
jgi:hypothetical protein